MNIYVSNLSFNVQDEDLKGLFTPFGEVSSAKIINDNTSGRSRGFGFVEMPDDEAAGKAIADLDKAEIDGRSINVVQAKPREERPRSNNTGGSGYGGSDGYGGQRSNDGYKKKW